MNRHPRYPSARQRCQDRTFGRPASLKFTSRFDEPMTTLLMPARRPQESGYHCGGFVAGVALGGPAGQRARLISVQLTTLDWPLPLA